MPWSPVAKAPAPSKKDARDRSLILRGRVNYLLGHSQQKAIYKAAKDSNMLPKPLAPNQAILRTTFYQQVIWESLL